MKVEIDLDDVFGEEGETLQDSVRRQVVDNISSLIKSGVGKKIDEEVSRIINAEVQSAVIGIMPSLLDGLMDAEYTPVGTYGDRGTKTTARKQLVKLVTEQMVYKPTTYNSDKNAFTRCVDAVLAEQVGSFKKLFDSTVDGKFVDQAMAYATKKLAERLKIAA